jgi:pyridoxal phosphate enzyme (YggS family)
MHASIWIGSGGIVMHITKNLEDLKHRISAACRLAGRSENEVAILAVSKLQTIESITAAAAAGLNSMGENYVQEALGKMAQCNAAIQWHFIGRIQSNKTRAIAENFSWVQTVASLSIAERLDRQRPAHLGPLNVCVQVDVDGSGAHGGIRTVEAEELCTRISQLNNLRLRGLMTVPAPTSDIDSQRTPFRRLQQLHRELVAQGFTLDTLSMGMTGDLEAAVLEGSTMLRIGTALFGPRLN